MTRPTAEYLERVRRHVQTVSAIMQSDGTGRKIYKRLRRLQRFEDRGYPVDLARLSPAERELAESLTMRLRARAAALGLDPQSITIEGRP